MKNLLTKLTIATSSAVGLLLLLSNSVHAATVPESCFITTGTVAKTITDYNVGGVCTTDPDIPATIGGVPVTAIGDRAFQNKNLTAITIPSSIASIGVSGFSHNQLTSVAIPSSISSINNYVFSVNQLTSIVIPDSVTTIGDQAFGFNKLTNVTVPNTVTSLGFGVFEANQISYAIIPNTLGIQQWAVFGAQATMGGHEFTSAIWASCTSAASCALKQQAIDTLFYAKVYFQNTSVAGVAKSNSLFQWSEINGDDSWDDPVPYGGHLINPAQITINYQDSSGNTLRPSDTYTGEHNGSYIFNYMYKDGPTIPVPYDVYEPTPVETQAIQDALNAYYRIGQTQTFTAPAIAGYTTPANATITFSQVTNEHTFVYQVASGTTTTSPTATNSNLSQVGDTSSLASTGQNQKRLIVAITFGLGIIVAGALLARKKLNNKK